MDLEGLNLESETITPSYNFIELVFLITSAVISGAKNSEEIEQFGLKNIDWLRKYRAYSQGIPSSHTLDILIQRISPIHFYNIFVNFLNPLRRSQNTPEITYRCIQFPSNIQLALNTISINICRFKLIIIQHKFNVKRNEQQAVLEILESFILRNALITVYAKNTQKKIADKIIQKKGNYIITLKQNYKKFTEELIAYFHKENRDSSENIKRCFELINTSCCREYQKAAMSDWIDGNLNWHNIKNIFQIKWNGHHQQAKTYFYLSSLHLDIFSLSTHIAPHWKIENCVHWHLDITYSKKLSQFKSNKTTKKMTALKRLARYLAYLHPLKSSIRKKLKMTYVCEKFRDELLLGVKMMNQINGNSVHQL